MKKVLSFLMVMILTLCITGCLKKEKISEEKFNKILTEKKYNVVDYTSNIEDFPGDKMYFASNNDGYAITLMLFKNNDDAESAYNTMINSINEEDAKIRDAKEKNYNKRIISSNKNYYIVIRIEDEIIMAYGSKDKESKIKEAMKMLGL